MKKPLLLIALGLYLFMAKPAGWSQDLPHNGNFENPVSMEWIHENLRQKSPRLVLTPRLEMELIQKLETDPLVQSAFLLLRNNAERILTLETLAYNKLGKRLLSVSRDAVWRMSTLALVYRIDRKEAYLDKLETELESVCGFGDWNPSHFLDVAEMAHAVALAVDWAGEWLDPRIKDLALEALTEKALKPSIAASRQNMWINDHHNWNLVCHGGLTFGALAVYEKEPELASYVLHRAVEKIPLGLQPYAPDGVYPEGPSYWFYATEYLTAAISAFNSALGTDFGFSSAPGFMESAVYSQVTAGPSGNFLNFFDCSLDGYYSLTHLNMLAWFRSYGSGAFDKTVLIEKLDRILQDPIASNQTPYPAEGVLSLVSLPDETGKILAIPESWIGDGPNPICVFRDTAGGAEAFFLAAKGGRAADNHGNMDAGSFVFEKDGIRWSVDPGNQNYYALEQVMGDELWNHEDQSSRRWSLLTKNNFGHSTLTVNDEPHLVTARATLIENESTETQPTATFDLTPVFGDNLDKAHRTFLKTPDNRLLITDDLVFNDNTSTITWQLVTTAKIRISKKKLTLKQEGEQLYLFVLSDLPYDAKAVSLSPPPLSYDKDIEGLKRLDIVFERNDFQGKSGKIEVEIK